MLQFTQAEINFILDILKSCMEELEGAADECRWCITSFSQDDYDQAIEMLTRNLHEDTSS